MRKLPYGKQTIEEDDIAAVVEVLKGDFLTTGPMVQKFEEALAQAVNAKDAVVCSNGTAALHLSALALGLGPGDAVIVPTMTFLATANAARFVGAEVVFSDVNPRTGLMEVEHLQEALDRVPEGLSAKAVFPVHLNGQSGDMKSLSELARSKNLKIVEDACHALGTKASDDSWRTGDTRFSDVVCFSFHPVKTIAMGEGGAVTTNDASLAERLKMYRSHCMTKNAEEIQNREMAFDSSGELNRWYYEMPEFGFNYRQSDINCALGYSQLKKLERFVSRRRELVTLYDKALADFEWLSPIEKDEGQKTGWHLYPVQIDFSAIGMSRSQLMQKLADVGIYTQVHYIPVHTQPYYRERYGAVDLPGGTKYYESILSLPLFPAMEDGDIGYVVEQLLKIRKESI